MSGELQSMYDYEPPDPTKVEKPRRRRRERRAPTTRGAVILHGLARLALLLGGSVGAVVLIGWLVARHSGSPLGDVLPTAFYIAGAGVGVLALLGGTGVGRSYRSYGALRAGRERPAATRGQQLGLLRPARRCSCSASGWRSTTCSS